MNDNIIYKKNYPRLAALRAMDKSWQKSSDRDPHLGFTFDELISKISADITLVPLPGREESSKEFIRLAIEVSEIYEISVKIERCPNSIAVEYYLDCGGCWREINRVFGMADEIAFFKDTDGFDITVVLDYFTHATVRRGKVISP